MVQKGEVIMKKICKAVLSIFLCLTIIGMSGISDSYASSHIPSIDEKDGRNLIRYIIKKSNIYQ